MDLTYYTQTKLRFILTFNVIGFFSSLGMLTLFALTKEINPFVSTITTVVLPIFLAGIYFCYSKKVIHASYSSFLTIVCACSISPFLNIAVFISFITIFIFSYGLLSIRKIQFYGYIFLITVACIFKLLLEIDSFSLKFFSPSSLSVSNLSLLSIFIFSIFSYSLFIYYLVEKGLRNSEELLLAKLALEKQNRETEEASNSKSIFLARVNHELRTPMQAALSASELLPQSPENLPILRAAISQSLLIIEDILDFTRIAKNNMKLQSKKFSLLLGMHELIQVYQSKTPDSVEIQTEFAADIPSHFIGDPTRFFDIIRNLLSNAVKWTNSGIIKVKLYWEDQSYSRLGFTITDNGPGIPDDLIKNIFEPFIQGKLRHTSEQGVGLGLYIARKAVEAMNGSIKVQNRKEGGAIFSFSIALQPCKEWLNANEKENHCYQCPNNPKILQHTIANNKTINYKLKILIVEDVEVNANLLKKLLHREGFQELELAFTGQEAIKKITELRPDIVFLDLNLPDMDGFNIVRTLRERNIEPKYIVLTGDATTDVFEHCREIGLNNILPKPAKINKIMEALHQAQ